MKAATVACCMLALLSVSLVQAAQSVPGEGPVRVVMFTLASLPACLVVPWSFQKCSLDNAAQR